MLVPHRGLQQKVLVVDPDLDFSEMVAEYISLQAGLVAKSASDLVDVGFQLGRFQPDVVLCSMEMPSFASILPHVNHLKARLVVLTNARDRPTSTLREDLKCSAVVEKPVVLEGLVELIHDL